MSVVKSKPSKTYFTRIARVSTFSNSKLKPCSLWPFPVEFWLLPLDHYLRIADDVTMDVYVRNPKGTRVALWDDVPSGRTAPFRFALSELAVVGEWTVEVAAEGVTFKTAVNVSNARGAGDPPKREQTITEEHFVELRFGREMRHKYKPGLPFLGKVSIRLSDVVSHTSF